MEDLSQGIGGRTISFSCGSLWAYTVFKPKVSLWFYVQGDHMLVRYLYLICNPLKIKILLLVCATHQVWKLRDPGKQAELSEVFKAKTLDSELSQTSTVDERWTSLKDKLLQATKQVCGVSSNHPWRKQTWWWNNQVEEAVREKRRCFKLWKAGGSRAAYNTAKRTSNRAVHQARSEAEKVALQKIDPRSGDVYRLA